MKRYPPAVIVLGLGTAIQAGTALWRIGIMYQEGLAAGPRPIQLTIGLLEEVGLSLFIAFVAWWWLPRSERTGGAWAIRFIGFAWILALGQMTWVVTAGFFEHGVSWAILLLLFIAGTLIRGRPGDQASLVSSGDSVAAEETPHPAALAGAVLWLMQLPHLFFPYHWTDTRDIWACRAVAFDMRGNLTGIFDCLDPGRPPLHSVLLWLGHTNGTMEGRLLPFLLVGAFGLVIFHFFRRLAPRVAPWGLLWFFMTVRVYQGAVSNYADVPVMIAIAIGIFLALDDRKLVGSTWQAFLFALIAGMAAALIKRDGGALVFVAGGVVLVLLRRWRKPLTYAALTGAALGLVLWSIRPANLYVPSVFDPRSAAPEVSSPAPIPLVPALPVVSIAQTDSVQQVVPDTINATVGTYVTMFYGMQGQILSHYGFGLFAPTWIILGIWVWRRKEKLPPEGRLYAWIAVLGWLAIVGIYVVHVSTGHPYRGSLRVIRTAFGRHLVHMFAFALLSAAAMAEVVLFRFRPEASGR
jgi:hypothetical protein